MDICHCCIQPLDLCSPDRTLLMAEEMVLHQADLLPMKVPEQHVYCQIKLRVQISSNSSAVWKLINCFCIFN